MSVSEYHILKKSFEEMLFKDIIITLFEKQSETMDFDISSISIVEEMATEIRDKTDF